MPQAAEVGVQAGILLLVTGSLTIALVWGAVGFASALDIANHHTKSACKVTGSFVWLRADISEVTGRRRANCDDTFENVSYTDTTNTTNNITAESTSGAGHIYTTKTTRWKMERSPNLNMNCREYWPAVREREREMRKTSEERERDTERQRETERDRERERETETESQRQTDIDIDRQTDRECNSNHVRTQA